MKYQSGTAKVAMDSIMETLHITKNRKNEEMMSVIANYMSSRSLLAEDVTGCDYGYDFEANQTTWISVSIQADIELFVERIQGHGQAIMRLSVNTLPDRTQDKKYYVLKIKGSYVMALTSDYLIF
jgi:hypothetical protein